VGIFREGVDEVRVRAGMTCLEKFCDPGRELAEVIREGVDEVRVRVTCLVECVIQGGRGWQGDEEEDEQVGIHQGGVDDVRVTCFPKRQSRQEGSVRDPASPKHNQVLLVRSTYRDPHASGIHDADVS
jgi:hypothetical protein